MPAASRWPPRSTHWTTRATTSAASSRSTTNSANRPSAAPPSAPSAPSRSSSSSGARLAARQSQHLLGDQVLQDLGGAGGDRGAPGEQPAPREVVAQAGDGRESGDV